MAEVSSWAPVGLVVCDFGGAYLCWRSFWRRRMSGGGSRGGSFPDGAETIVLPGSLGALRKFVSDRVGLDVSHGMWRVRLSGFRASRLRRLRAGGRSDERSCVRR